MILDICPATHDDISYIHRIEQFIESHYPANRQTLINRLEMFPDGFLIAKYDHQLIGYIESCIWNEESFSTYQDICQFSNFHNSNGMILFVIFIGVDKQYQKMGVGSLLLDALKVRIKKRYPHIKKVNLVSKQKYVNNFYRKNDFQKIKRLPDYTFEYPGVLMEYRFDCAPLS